MSDILKRAREVATSAHSGQRYGAGADYTVHLAAVESVLRRFGVEDEELLAAGWLHDTIEDTSLRRDLIAEWFGLRVLAVVSAVTDEPGQNRHERHEKTYPKTRAAGPDAISVKLADRIANIEASLAELGGGKLDMYRKEQADFRHALLDGREAEAIAPEPLMWAHIDSMLDRIIVVGNEPGPDEDAHFESCCFCRKPTTWWSVRRGKKIGQDDVACCRKCASQHRLSELPTKQEWLASQQVKDRRPTSTVRLPQSEDEPFWARAPDMVYIEGADLNAPVRARLNGDPVWREGLLVRMPAEFVSVWMRSHHSREFEIEDLERFGRFIRVESRLIGDVCFTKLRRSISSINDPCETCGEPLDCQKAVEFRPSLVHDPVSGMPVRYALFCHRGHRGHRAD